MKTKNQTNPQNQKKPQPTKKIPVWLFYSVYFLPIVLKTN